MDTEQTKSKKKALRRSTVSEKENGVTHRSSSKRAGSLKKLNTATRQPAMLALKMNATASLLAFSPRLAIRTRGAKRPSAAKRKTNPTSLPPISIEHFSRLTFLHP